MQSILKSDIFFFIASIGFTLWTIVFVIIGIYLIKIMKNFSDISEKLKDDVDSARAELKEISEHVRESVIFRLIFGRPKKKKAHPKS